ncbi:hypothetical protein V6N13_085954 [Hibiscus sabdariffa]|uniref:Uncharacterized protein n=1 Tax=Hibiscus sabdariffa TaxID=183260 RepID=A0ABR2FRQ5_9ROSI
MASTTKFSYQRLKHEEEEEGHGHAEVAGRARPWLRLRRVSVKKRFRVRVPSLRRLLRKKVKLVRVSLGKMVKRLKESQAHFGDLFAGNYMFIQVNPSTMTCFFEKSGPDFASSLPRIA